MVNAPESLDRTGIYNGVLVTGQGDADDAARDRACVYSDASSPGPLGRPVRTCRDCWPTPPASPPMSRRRGHRKSLLNLRLKQTRSLTLTTAPNPALVAGDTIQVVFPDGRSETHLIDSTTIDLATAAQQITTRTLFAPTLVELFHGRDAWREANEAHLVAA